MVPLINTPEQYLKNAGLVFEGTALESALQKHVINQILKEQDSPEFNKNPFNQSYDFWLARSVRHIEINSAPEKYQSQKLSQLDYLFRHHPATTWRWREDELSLQIQQLLQPYLKFFKHLTRIKIHLQKKSRAVILHRDLSAGQTYYLKNEISTEQGAHFIPYRMYPWVDLKDFDFGRSPQDYCRYSLKVPLSEDVNNYGRQILSGNPQTESSLYYTTHGNFYFLDESQFHAADQVPHLRGLIFIDGILDMDVVRSVELGRLTPT